MLRTYYAHGRPKLPIPVATLQTGTVNGNNSNYYLWVQARNRVGYNSPSDPLQLTIGAAKSLHISGVNFTALPYEGWRTVAVSLSTTSNYSDARVIAEVSLYETDQVTLRTPQDIVINAQALVTGNATYATPSLVPTSVHPEGFRIKVTSLGNVYSYIANSTLIPNGLTVLDAGSNARWVLVPSNMLNEPAVTCNKEIYQVTQEELQHSPFPVNAAINVPTKYYIQNDRPGALQSGELDLNIYKSDKSLQVSANVIVAGYVDNSTYQLDTANIQYVGAAISYPGTIFSLSKPLPAGSYLVFDVLPVIEPNQQVLPGSYLSLYPRLNTYTNVVSIENWAEGVASIAMLQALPQSVLKNQQSVHVKSLNRIYTYISDSAAAADGDVTVMPGFNPTTGRWISNSAPIGNQSITLDKLAPEVLSAFANNVANAAVTLNSSTSYTVNFNTLQSDHLVLTTPVDDGEPTIINFTHSALGNNQTNSKLLELVQRSGTVQFHSSILFPGGNQPVLSGDGKSDLLLLTIQKNAAGQVKKRAMVLHRNIG